MYGLPADFDVQILIGRTLNQICVTSNQLTLHFDGDVHITLEGPYTYRDRNGTVESNAERVDGHGVLAVLCLLEQSIIKVEADRDGTLRLEFPADAHFSCIDTPSYESYHIRVGTRVITV